MNKTDESRDSSCPATRCVRAESVAEMVDISVRTLHRKVAMGEFPRPIRIGHGNDTLASA